MSDRNPYPPPVGPEDASGRTEPLPPLPSAGGDPPPPGGPAQDHGEPSPPGRHRMPRWLPPAIAVLVIAGLAVALVFVLIGGDDEPATAEAAGGASTEFLAAAQGPVRQLNRSAQVSGRVLTRASRPNDVNRIARMASQQLAVVQEARQRLSEIPAPGPDRAARGALSRATQAHRTYLVSLSRLDTIPTARARAQLSRLRTQAQKTLGQYRAFFALASGLPKGITSAGLADLSGLNQALIAKQKQEREAAEAEQQSSTGGGSGGSGSGGDTGGSPSGVPVISGVYGSDNGSFVAVGADYCDRTPGAVNDFIYTFEIRRNGVTVASDSYGASQTRACNGISMTFDDVFALGSYEVVVRVSNLTNNVSASATGSLSVVN